MPIYIIMFVIAIVTVAFIVIKLKKSPKFDSFVHDLTEPVDVAPKSTDKVIKEISEYEKTLQQKAKEAKKIATEAEKEDEKIGKYLTDKNVIRKTKKGGPLNNGG